MKWGCTIVYPFQNEHWHFKVGCNFEMSVSLWGGWLTILNPFQNNLYETKVWLISILIITKQGLELMIIFQVCLGKTIPKVAITKTNQAKEKSCKEDHLKEKCFSRPKLHKISLYGCWCIRIFMHYILYLCTEII